MVSKQYNLASPAGLQHYSYAVSNDEMELKDLVKVFSERSFKRKYGVSSRCRKDRKNS